MNHLKTTLEKNSLVALMHLRAECEGIMAGRDFARAKRSADKVIKQAFNPPIHCPTCGSERGVAIPESCPHREEVNP